MISKAEREALEWYSPEVSASRAIGSSLVKGEIIYVSVTQLDRFDLCNRKWWFRYVRKAPEPQSKGQKVGDQVHKQIEHYEKTGQDVLGDIARAGLRFIPKPGPDLVIEKQLAYFEDARTEDDRTIGPVKGRLRSHLYAGGIPVVGKADLLHCRDVWIDDDGTARVNSGCAEVEDWKTSKQIEDEVDEDTGVVTKRGWAKTGEELADTWQMTGYGELARLTWPDVKAVRLSHGYFQTQGRRCASKRTILVPVGTIAARWKRADAIVDAMRVVARTERVEDVTPNYSACSSFGGCPHSAACPRDARQVLDKMFAGKAEGLLRKVREERSMGFLDKMKKRPDAAVEAEKAKLLAEERSMRSGIVPPDAPAPEKTHEPIPAEAPPEVQKFAKPAADPTWSAKCQECGTLFNWQSGSMLADGTAKHIGCPGKTVAVDDTPVSYACIPPGQRELTTKEAVDKKIRCHCGETLKIKAKEMDGRWFALVPEHKKPAVSIKVEQDDGSMKPIEPLKVEQVAPMSLPEQTEQSGTATKVLIAPTIEGFDIYLDCFPDGIPVQRLDSYVDRLAEVLASTDKVNDIRCVPKDSSLAYGGWRGAISALAKHQPPPPGTYVVSSSNEIALCVAQALRGKARRFVQGVK